MKTEILYTDRSGKKKSAPVAFDPDLRGTIQLPSGSTDLALKFSDQGITRIKANAFGRGYRDVPIVEGVFGIATSRKGVVAVSTITFHAAIPVGPVYRLTIAPAK